MYAAEWDHAFVFFVLSLVKMLSGLNAFGISNIHGGEFKVRSLWKSNVTMLRLARIRRKEFLRTCPYHEVHSH
jgi:hypothetical protein